MHETCSTSPAPPAKNLPWAARDAQETPMALSGWLCRDGPVWAKERKGKPSRWPWRSAEPWARCLRGHRHWEPRRDPRVMGRHFIPQSTMGKTAVEKKQRHVSEPSTILW